MAARDQVDADQELESGAGYSGTFRWKRTKALPSMPAVAGNRVPRPGSLDLTDGWKGYFASRSLICDKKGINMIKIAHSDLSIVDCLSCPLSILHFLRTADLGLDWSKQYESISIICMGCSEKAEERILRETNSFEEVALGLSNVAHIDLWLVGPEMSVTARHLQQHTFAPPQDPSSSPNRLQISLFKGGVTDFIRSHPEYLSKSTVVVGFNCGFGNFENPLPRRYDLFLSWLPDLQFLTSTQLPTAFFCANDYADLRGEGAIMSMLGAQFISLPAENPFSFASTMIPPESEMGRDGCEYARGNSFWYAVQGSNKELRLTELKGASAAGPVPATLLAHLLPRAVGLRFSKITALRAPGKLVLTELTWRAPATLSVSAPAPLPKPKSALVDLPTPPSAPVSVMPLRVGPTTEPEAVVAPQPPLRPLSPAPATEPVSELKPVLAPALEPASHQQPPTHRAPARDLEATSAQACSHVEFVRVSQDVVGDELVVFLLADPCADIKTAALDLHRSGDFLKLSFTAGTGNTKTVTADVAFMRKVAPLAQAMKAKYSRKTNSLTLKLKLV